MARETRPPRDPADRQVNARMDASDDVQKSHVDQFFTAAADCYAWPTS